MSKVKLFISLQVFVIIFFITSCKKIKEKNETVIFKKDISFLFSKGQQLFIDINNDKIYDFKCLSIPFGNRFRKVIIPINAKNKISDHSKILEKGVVINENIFLSNEFDFNKLGASKESIINNKYIGVQFEAEGFMHYGWIKFSLEPKDYKNLNTPIYYQKIKLNIHETAYNLNYDKQIVIN